MCMWCAVSLQYIQNESYEHVHGRLLRNIMKILALNIQHGGGGRASAILQAINAHQADTIVLTEFRENKNSGRIRCGLFSDGYIYQFSGSIEPKLNSVFIASKTPFVPKTDILSPKLKHRIVGAQFTNLLLLGFYFPGKDEKKPVFEELYDVFQSNFNNPVLAMGDLNTGKHYVDEKGASFYCAEYMDKFDDLGFVDVWRKLHKDKTEYTWYSNAGNGFRIDHAFASPVLESRVEDSWYSHKEREDSITDHSALVVKVLEC